MTKTKFCIRYIITMKRTAKISILIIVLFVMSSSFAFELRYHHDASGQRRDGTKLFDITYELTDLGGTDSVNIFVWAVTQSNEILAFCLPDTTWGTFSGDTGTVHGPGIKHILWNIGLDQPNREFYTDRIQIIVAAAMMGWDPDVCPEAAIAGGYLHTIALKSDGTVWAWGDNGDGQLGDNTSTDRHTPVQVHGEDDIGNIEDIIAIAAGAWHTVALRADGTVWAWGRNDWGQLGDDTATDSWTPVMSLLPW